VKIIFFDFDGVILDCADIKTDAFRNIFEEICPKRINEIIDYYEYNGGVSRRIKFAYVYKVFLNKEITEEESNRLSDRFTEMTLNKIKKAPTIKGLIEFLKNYSNGTKYVIASGAPHEQLIEIIKFRNLDGYFKQVVGAPTKKSETILKTLKDLKLEREEAIFIGDAMTDYEEAQKSKVLFIGLVKKDKKNPFPEEINVGKDFFEISKIINKLT
jgi:HAD superfamily hydrolase (TIGR01549 family)